MHKNSSWPWLPDKMGADCELLRDYLACIAESAVITDAEGRILFLNRAAGELIGRNSADVVGAALESVFHFIHNQTGQPVVEIIKSVRRQGALADTFGDLDLLDGDGRAVPISLNAVPLSRADGSAYGVALTFMDCSAQRRAQQELRLVND